MALGAGRRPAGRREEFLGAPDTQLNDWPVDGRRRPLRASRELFFDYLLDHYGGRDNARALAAEKANGIAGVDAFLDGLRHDVRRRLRRLRRGDPAGQAGRAVQPRQLRRHDKRGYGPDAGATAATGTSQPVRHGLLHASGGTFTFDGAGRDDDRHPGDDGAFWWSGRSDGDRLPPDPRSRPLGRAARRRSTFDAWWDIEDGWDYAYVSASTDGGDTWTALPGTHTTDQRPGLGGVRPRLHRRQATAGGRETVDLGAYAGQKVLLRFEYITDDATNLTGFAVDNIAIPAIGSTTTSDAPQPAGPPKGSPDVDGTAAAEVHRAGDHGQRRSLHASTSTRQHGHDHAVGPAHGSRSPAPRSTRGARDVRVAV